MPRPFLTANWTNLCIVSYTVDPSLLEPRLPPGLDLDLWDGQALVSLVAFDFHKTRVFWARWPGLTNFPEINLRYYVRAGERRGVCFVREFVPRRLVALIARRFYNEPYDAAPMASRVTAEADWVDVHHGLTFRGKTHVLHLRGSGESVLPGPDTLEHFIKERPWGFGTDRRGRTVRYRVLHPAWKVKHAKLMKLDFNWETVYGKEWQSLHDARPASVLLARGSAIEILPCEMCEQPAPAPTSGRLARPGTTAVVRH
jgi:uncharacterized protein YqjF (DUF2071 family)